MRCPPSLRTRTGVGAAVALTLLAIIPLGVFRPSGSPGPRIAAPARSPLPPVTKAQGTLPPNNPPSNVAPSPNFLNDCSGSQYDDSNRCVGATLQAIANARAYEGLGPMSLPSNWGSLSPAEQLYVATNLERTDRGLPLLSGMATALDQSSAQGAQQSQDPTPPPGFPWSSWGSNWAGAVGNPLEAIYYWMYDDGEGSNNIDCTPSNQSGCWGHRDNILMSLNCQPCLMGTALDPTGYQGYPSWAELLVDTTGNPSLDFSWSWEAPYLNDTAASGSLDPALFEFMANGTGNHPWNAYDQTSATGSPSMYGSTVALADPVDGYIHVFFHGANGHLLEYVNDGKTSGTPWSTYDLTAESGSSNLVEGNPGVLVDNGELHVYIEGANGDLMEFVNDGVNGSPWNAYDQSAAAGAGGISGTPCAVLLGSVVHVYVRGWNGDLIEYIADHANGRVWNAYDQTVGAGNGIPMIGTPSARALGGAVHVYVEGSNGHLVEFVNDGVGGHPWNAYDQSAGAVGGSGVTGSPASIVLGGVVHVFVAGPGGDLVEYVNDDRNGRPWSAYDQTAATGAVTGITDQPGPIVVGGYVHVYGRAANGDLVEFLNDGQNGRIWNVYDQTLASGGPGVSGDPSPVFWGGMVHVYVGAG